MIKDKIELLRQQAQTYLMLAKVIKDPNAKRMYLINGKKCVMMALEIRDLDKTDTFEYKLVS